MRVPVRLAVAVALLTLFAAPIPAAAQGVSLADFAFGFEAGSLRQNVDGGATLSGVWDEGGSGIETTLTNRVSDTKVSRGLAKVTYLASPIASPYVLLGLASLSFDDEYEFTGGNLASSVDQTVEVSDSAVAFGLGAEGKLLRLPASLTLGYGIRFLTFRASDEAEVLIEDVSQFEEADIATEVSYSEWSMGLTVSREVPLRGDVVLTPYGGLRHTSVHMNATSEIAYRPIIDNQPVAIRGSLGRSIDGNLNSLVLGCSGSLAGKLTAFAQFVAVGETGVELGVGYRF